MVPWQDWVTAERVGLEDYYKGLMTHRFVFAPPGKPGIENCAVDVIMTPVAAGNGLDTHRAWEALLLGAIPIHLNNSIAAMFTRHNLPVLVGT